MRSHIFFALLTAFVFTACASKEHVSTTQTPADEKFEYSKYEGAAGRIR